MTPRLFIVALLAGSALGLRIQSSPKLCPYGATMGFPDSAQCQGARYRAARVILQTLAGTSATVGLYSQMNTLYALGSKLQTNLTAWNSSVQAEMDSVFGTSKSVGDLLRETSHNMYHDADMLFQALQEFDPMMTQLSQSATTAQQGMESAWLTDYSSVIETLNGLNTAVSTSMATNIENLKTAYDDNLVILSNAGAAMQTLMSTNRASYLAAANADVTKGMLQLNTANSSRDTITSINNTLASMGSHLTGFSNTLIQIISDDLTDPMQTAESGYTTALTTDLNAAVTSADSQLGSAGTVSTGFYSEESGAITAASTAFGNLMTPVWQTLSENVTTLASDANSTIYDAVLAANETAANLEENWNKTMTSVNATRDKDLNASTGIATSIGGLKTDATTWYGTAQTQYNTLSQQITQTQSNMIGSLQSQAGDSANSMFQNILWAIGNVTQQKKELLATAAADAAALQSQIAGLAASMGVSTQTFEDAFIDMQEEVATLQGMLNSSALNLSVPIHAMTANFSSQLQTAATNAELTAIQMQKNLSAAHNIVANSSAELLANATAAALSIRTKAQESNSYVTSQAGAIQTRATETAAEIEGIQKYTVGNLSQAQQTLTTLNSALPTSRSTTLKLIADTSDHVTDVAKLATGILTNFADHVKNTLDADTKTILDDAQLDLQQVSTAVKNQITQDTGTLTGNYAPLTAMLVSYQEATDSLAGEVQPLVDTVYDAAVAANATISKELKDTLDALETDQKAADADFAGETADFARDLAAAARTAIGTVDPAVAAVVKPATDLVTTGQKLLSDNSQTRMELQSTLDGLHDTLSGMITQVSDDSEVTLGSLSDTFEGAMGMNESFDGDYGLLTGMQQDFNESQYSAIDQINKTATEKLAGILSSADNLAKTHVGAFKVSMQQLQNSLANIAMEIDNGEDGFPAADLAGELKERSESLSGDVDVAMTTQSHAVRDEMISPIAALAGNIREALEYQFNSANSVGSQIDDIAGGASDALESAAGAVDEAITTGKSRMDASRAAAEKSASEMETSHAESAQGATDVVAGLQETLDANAASQKVADDASHAASTALSGTIAAAKQSLLSNLGGLNSVLTQATSAAGSATAGISQEVPMQARMQLASDGSAWKIASKASLASVEDTKSQVKSLSGLFKSMFGASVSKNSKKINEALTSLSDQMTRLRTFSGSLQKMSSTIGDAQDQSKLVHEAIKGLADDISSKLQEATDSAVEATKKDIAEDIAAATTSLERERGKIYKLISAAR